MGTGRDCQFSRVEGCRWQQYVCSSVLDQPECPCALRRNRRNLRYQVDESPSLTFTLSLLSRPVQLPRFSYTSDKLLHHVW